MTNPSQPYYAGFRHKFVYSLFTVAIVKITVKLFKLDGQSGRMNRVFYILPQISKSVSIALHNSSIYLGYIYIYMAKGWGWGQGLTCVKFWVAMYIQKFILLHHHYMLKEYYQMNHIR